MLALITRLMAASAADATKDAARADAAAGFFFRILLVPALHPRCTKHCRTILALVRAVGLSFTSYAAASPSACETTEAPADNPFTMKDGAPNFTTLAGLA
jgi:hypothetical protein